MFIYFCLIIKLYKYNIIASLIVKKLLNIYIISLFKIYNKFANFKYFIIALFILAITIFKR